MYGKTVHLSTHFPKPREVWRRIGSWAIVATMSDAVPESRQAPIAKWIGFTAMCLGMFMAVLDIQIVVTSLPAIEAALGIGVERMSWVQTAYLIAEVIAIPLTGLLTRVFTLPTGWRHS